MFSERKRDKVPYSPNLLSEAIGSLMVSSPDWARAYLNEHSLRPGDPKGANEHQVWERLADLSPEVSMNLLNDPAFEKDAQGIASALAANSPERVPSLLDRFDGDQDVQHTLLIKALIGLDNRLTKPPFPGDAGGENWRDPHEVREILQQAINDSDLPDDAKNNLQVILRDSIPSQTE
jgi:hypothetical protein